MADDATAGPVGLTLVGEPSTETEPRTETINIATKASAAYQPASASVTC